MGAAFNFNLLEHDPGAYAHNRIYTKRLIYDSIDWVDDGIMNYSVGATLTTRLRRRISTGLLRGGDNLSSAEWHSRHRSGTTLTHTQVKEVIDRWNN